MNSKIGSGYTYVDSAEALTRVIEALEEISRVGLDTEADSLHHYFEKVCLIQLSFLGMNYVIDPLAGFSLDGFLEVLSLKELILQGADYDLRMLKKSFGFRPKAPVFDTMLAAQVLGYEKIGLAALAEKYCGVALSKSGQKSDWARRPLSAKQLDYAADDTKYLETIADAMAAGLRELNRVDWHRECCERAVEVSGILEQSDPDEAWRIKGSSKLAPKTLAFVRELWKWRDAEARAKDRPPFMILQNENVIELAEWGAGHPQEPLQGGPAFMKRISGERLARLENAIRTAENLPPSEWPVSPKRVRTSQPFPLPEKVEKLLAACKIIAAEYKIEACFLASRAAVTNIVRYQARSVESVIEASGMMRWQAGLILPAVKAVLGESPENFNDRSLLQT
ncbi:MAG TPA: HRDC domain-containing protein [Candidatus Omnitrophota bacterium]|nr:HRDC domain-containing protein [Candidatus Omnitrophota bacterium]